MQHLEVFVLNYLPTRLSQQITKIYFRVLCLNQREDHSKQLFLELKKMNIKILPALYDNYMYLIVDKATKEAAVVDPVNPNLVLDAVNEHEVNLTTILTTHHHWDHSGGNSKLVKLKPGLKVYGGDNRVNSLTDRVFHNTNINVGKLNIRCLLTPCHTSSHICYYVTTPEEDDDSVIFTGDTLFLGGCGKFFEGNATQMYKALITILSDLPDNTKVFCGHETTIGNLKFAAHVEPDNNEISKKIDWSLKQRHLRIPTVPSTIGEEKLYNPFMRVDLQSIQTHVNKANPIATMEAIRYEKNYFNSR